jgi:hypothetical protein
MPKQNIPTRAPSALARLVRGCSHFELAVLALSSGRDVVSTAALGELACRAGADTDANGRAQRILDDVRVALAASVDAPCHS